MPARERSEHYVNNKEFLDAIVAYRIKVLREAQKEIPDITAEQLKDWKSPNKPRITNYLGECFLKIATHLSYKPNFVNYMFREDMISDGIENCVQYMLNFDPKKSNNPFAYFTQIIHYAFLRRIQKEKKQLEIKTKIIERTGYDQVMVVEDGANGTSSDYNSIKEKIHYKLNRQ
jgi:hypothetical protein